MNVRPITLAAAVVLIWEALSFQSASGSIIVYQEDFDSFTVGAIAGQNGWTAALNTPQIAIGDAGGSDHVVAGTDGSTQGNARNLSLYSIPSNTTELNFEGRMRMRGGNGNRVNFVDAAGTFIIGFGAGYGGFNFVVVDGADTKLYSGNAPGGNALSGSSHAWYDAIFTVNFNDSSDATGTFAVKKDGQASFSTLVSGLDLALPALYEDPTQWTGLLLEMRTSSNQQDDFLLSAVLVPEPNTWTLGLVGLVSLACRAWAGRRKRQLRIVD